MNTAHAAEFLAFTHGMIQKATKDWPAHQRTAQATGQPNHALWTLGHLSTAANWGAGVIDGKGSTIPESYDKLFGMGSVPVADAGAYPAYAEVVRHFEATYERLLSATKSLEGSAAQESVKEATGGFATTKLDMAYKMAWHDGWHMGQLTTLRKFLALPSVF